MEWKLYWGEADVLSLPDSSFALIVLDPNNPLIQFLRFLFMTIATIVSSWSVEQLLPPQRKGVLVWLAVKSFILVYLLNVSPNLWELFSNSKDEAVRTATGALSLVSIFFAVSIFWDIVQLTKQVDNKIQTTQDWRRELLEAVQTEVKERIQNSWLDEYLVPLQRQERPELVGRLSQPKSFAASTKHSILQSLRKLKLGQRRSVALDSSDKMIDVFQRNDVVGKLLIVGEPGAGKTTMLLKLAEELIKESLTDPDAPIPALFKLSNWKKTTKTESFGDWLVTQLIKRYKRIPKTIRQQWLNSGHLLPLLDGLDELKMVRQMEWVTAIKQFLADNAYPHLVVCCRSEEYEEGGIKLEELNGAVCLEPLTDEQIQKYFQQVSYSLLWREIQRQSAQ